MNLSTHTPRSLTYATRAVGALGLAIALALAAGCGRSEAETVAAADPPEVLAVAAKPADGELELRLPARAYAGESAQIYARATGFVRERQVDLGDRVIAGQVLATISAPEADQSVREAVAELGRASADQELAQVNFDRAQVLVGSGAISKEMFSDRKSNRDAAVAARAAAQARLSIARERSAFQSVRAPFAGVVAARNIERGDRVVADSAASAQPMFEINALDPLRIVIDVPQSAALQVRTGLQAEVRFPELPGETFQAEVARSAQNLSRDLGAMRVELRLPNADGRIPAGMVGEVRLKVPRAAPAVLVPVSAVIQGGAGPRVAALRQDSTLEFRSVALGRNLGSEIEIVSGLAAGDRVVQAPNALLAEGNKVRIKPPAAPRKS
ncbi:efflux RND transporter periplasmic adaptor subunit [Lysobacter sp. 5GHs7-4]|uniref:efflux RND transporter periplasmic adaptor subunit n=1 Tax=Lysobacter sp. 5GHs7-4 TaxID=2904253 RepID=UPI001E604228|nr:efflux RND transporter periplasmic adaptor subunit [Lysobacter sp. 5GHs7-4]UHQ23559.1 efflux RND transporter periplasmic adaptor subunit [Lysobacter sp. 5GHs7-4]